MRQEGEENIFQKAAWSNPYEACDKNGEEKKKRQG